ncbi:MAG: MotA/TolQ/ExbB proton channel family protein [Oscillospiraceae bacterium]|nr:MotA/TolQ/ExbB proton channel family protein [Oscillospiraceae bacterium]
MRALTDPLVWIIVAAGLGDLLLGWRILKRARWMKDQLSPRERRANPKEGRQRPLTEAQIREHEDRMVDLRGALELRYSLFVNLTSILPLLGMLGTVIALIGMSGNMDAAEVPVDQFFSALYTTAAGIVFAVANKMLDSVVSVKVAANAKEVDTLVERNHRRFSHEANRPRQGQPAQIPMQDRERP